MADSVGECVHPAGRFRRACITVNSHMTEVVAEPRLEVVSRTWVQRPAGRVQHLMNNGGGIARWWSQISGVPIIGFFFVAARGFTRTPEITFLPQRRGFDFYLGKRPLMPRCPPRHDLACHAVGLLLEGVVGLTNPQTARGSPRRWRGLGCPGGLALSLEHHHGSKPFRIAPAMALPSLRAPLRPGSIDSLPTRKIGVRRERPDLIPVAGSARRRDSSFLRPSTSECWSAGSTPRRTMRSILTSMRLIPTP